MTLDLAHFSLQYSDSTKQKAADAAKIFSRNYDAITGTESGELDTQRVMRVASFNAGYTFFVRRSNWVSIRKDLIKPGTYKTGHEAFVDNRDVVGHGHDLHVTWAQCEIERVGKVSFLASHYARYGRPNARSAEYRQNVEANRELARGIGGLAEQLGAGKALAFYGGDQNIVDRDVDTFFGEPLTSAWDELGKYENTGHGNIDVMASFDHDGRVKAKYIRALDDKELNLFTDHFALEAGFEVKLLRKKRS